MSALAPTRPDLATLPTPALRAELARGLALTADTLARLAVVWAELERRGEDLSDLRGAVPRSLPLVAAGRLAAEAVVAFAGRPALLRAIEGVPLARQRELAAGAKIDVADPEDPAAVRSVPVLAIPASRLGTVFADGAILPPAAQRVRLGAKYRPRPKATADYRYRVEVDKDAGTVRVGKMTVPLADVLTALAAAAGPDLPVPHGEAGAYETATAKLHPAEKERLRAACERAGNLPEWELIRKALRAYGLI